jgi:hypothetical protein
MSSGVWDNNPLLPNGIDPQKTLLENPLNEVAGGISSVKPMGKYLTGSRCIIKINNKLSAFAFKISWKIETKTKETRTIDNYLPYEITPTIISVSGQIGGFVLPGRDPTSQLLQASDLSFLFNRYISIEARDRTTDALLFKTDKALIDSQSVSIQEGQLANVMLTFKAIGWKAGKGSEIPVLARDQDRENLSDADANQALDDMFPKNS